MEPKVLQSPGKLIEKSNENVQKNCQTKKKTMSINDTLLKIQKDKKEKREKRHKEKLELIKNFMKIFNHKDSDSE